jgi:hypothetical protein
VDETVGVTAAAKQETDMACTPQQMAKLAGHVWSDHGSATFALFDGAGTPGLLDRLFDAPGLEFECLYSGELEPDIAEVAPYIARLEARTEFADWALGGWGEHRGIFAQAQHGVRPGREAAAVPVLRSPSAAHLPDYLPAG